MRKLLLALWLLVLAAPVSAQTVTISPTQFARLDELETLLTAIDTRVDGLEALIALTNGYVDGLEANTAELNDLILDYDSGGGTQNIVVFGIALPGSGGAVAGGTNTNPIQVGDAGGSLTIDGTVTITDGAGAVNVICDSGCAGGAQYTEDAAAAADPIGNAVILIRADTPGAVVTTNGDNVAQRGTNYGAAYVQVVDSSGNFINTFGGSGGTASNFGSAFPSAGTAAGMSDGTNMVALLGTTTQADNLANTLDGLNVTAFGYVFDGTTWDRLLGNSTDGVLVNLGANNDVTVTSGTITGVTTVSTVTSVSQWAGTAIPIISATLGDDLANTQDALAVLNLGYLFDGTTWDRARGDSTNGLLVNLGANNDVTITGEVDVTPASPAAGTYLPVRLTDGSTFLSVSQDWTVGSAIGTSGPGMVAVYSDFDGAALPTITNVDTEGESVPVAASIKGVQYMMLVSEDGSLQYGTTTTPLVIGDGAGAVNVICDSGCSGGTQYTQDAALTVATTIGTMAVGRASAAAPSDVSADNDAVIAWYLRSGAQVVQLSAGGTLIGSSSTNLNTNTVQWGSSAVVTGGSSGSVGVGGIQAHDAALSGNNPVLVGFEAKDFDGAALPNNVSAEGDVTRGATTLYGVQYVMLVSEDGSLERGTSTTPMVVGDGAGAMNVIIDSSATLTVNAHAVTNAGTFAVQVDGNALTALQLIDNASFADEAAFTYASSGITVIGGVAESTTDAIADGAAGALVLDTARRLVVTPTPSTYNGLSIYRSIDLDEGAGEVIKASAGQLYSLWVTNTSTATRFVKIYNATSCTMGTGTPVLTIGVPGNASDDVVAAFSGGGYGIEFTTGICFGATTGVADADTGAPGTNDVVANALYK
jgi:hypothetical protein